MYSQSEYAFVKLDAASLFEFSEMINNNSAKQVKEE